MTRFSYQLEYFTLTERALLYLRRDIILTLILVQSQKGKYKWNKSTYSILSHFESEFTVSFFDLVMSLPKFSEQMYSPNQQEEG